MDQVKLDELKAMCACGSGKPKGMCCGKDEMCPCGSGKKVSECCMVSPETHQAPAAE